MSFNIIDQEQVVSNAFSLNGGCVKNIEQRCTLHEKTSYSFLTWAGKL